MATNNFGRVLNENLKNKQEEMTEIEFMDYLNNFYKKNRKMPKHLVITATFKVEKKRIRRVKWRFLFYIINKYYKLILIFFKSYTNKSMPFLVYFLSYKDYFARCYTGKFNSNRIDNFTIFNKRSIFQYQRKNRIRRIWCKKDYKFVFCFERK